MASSRISAAKGRQVNCGAEGESMSVLVPEDPEKVQLVDTFSASVFTTKDSPQESQTSEVRDEGSRKEDFPLVVESWVRDRLDKLNTHKPLGSDGMEPRVLRELADVVALLPPSSLDNRGEREMCAMSGGRRMSSTLRKGYEEDLGYHW